MRPLRKFLPNALSASRIPAAAAFVLVYNPNVQHSYYVGIGCLVFAVATDFADGRLARAWGVCTDLGCFLDGLCDKIVYCAVLVVIAREAPELTALCWLLVVREILIYAVRSQDEKNIQTHLRFRSTSLLYASAIRLFFVGFLLWNQRRSEIWSIVNYYYIAGIIAVAIGLYHFRLTVISMRKEA